MEFGPDGALYVIDWGTGFSGNNLDSGIYRIDYTKGARRPIAHATATPDSGPLAAGRCSSPARARSTPTGTRITYAWDFDGDGDDRLHRRRTRPTATTTAGTYTARLTVTDSRAPRASTTSRSSPATRGRRSSITIPEDGQFANFGDIVPYEIVVTDAEDGTIDCSRVIAARSSSATTSTRTG